jgi:hypothetical protein
MNSYPVILFLQLQEQHAAEKKGGQVVLKWHQTT